MASRQLQVVSWNVDGLCGNNRVITTQRWIRSRPVVPSVVALQEIKADQMRLDAALKKSSQSTISFTVYLWMDVEELHSRLQTNSKSLNKGKWSQAEQFGYEPRVDLVTSDL